MACNSTYSVLEILKTESLPLQELELSIDECLCKAVYGVGSADLTGIGVLISLALQYAIAILFWLAGFMDQIFVPTYWHYSPRPLSIGLTDRHHQSCLWSQLVFCLALSLACLIRQAQRQQHVDAFESLCIPTVIPLTLSCLILATVSYLPRKGAGNKPMEKKAVFMAAYALAIVSGVIAMFGSFWAPRTDRILAECQVFAERNNMEWREVALPPMRVALDGCWKMFVVFTVTVICSFSAWHVLQRNMDTWERKSFRKRLFVAGIGLLSVLLIWMPGCQIYNIMYAKDRMEILWNSEAGQTDWTVGQIGALFSWAPLIVDMAHSVWLYRGDFSFLGLGCLDRLLRRRDPKPRKIGG